MKTLELQGTGLNTLAFADRPTPAIGPRDLLLRTRAASLNYRDLGIARGEYGNYKRPLVLGSDAVAEVIDIGREVTRFAVGDRVNPIDAPYWLAGEPDERTLLARLGGPLDGVFSEVLVASEEAVVPTPSHLTDEEASTLGVAGVTAWQALYVLGRLRPGDTVVVQGSGGVSLFALQLARLGGAQVIALSRSADKLSRVMALGATQGINTSATPEWEKEVLRLTRGRGADVVVDVLGGTTLGRSIAATRIGGMVAVLGFVESMTSSVSLPTAIQRGVALRTSTGRSRENFESLVRAVEAGGLRPVVDRVFDFAEMPAAFSYLASGAQFGKIVVRFP